MISSYLSVLWQNLVYTEIRKLVPKCFLRRLYRHPSASIPRIYHNSLLSAFCNSFLQIWTVWKHCVQNVSVQTHTLETFGRKKMTQNGVLRWCNKTNSHEQTPGKGDTTGFPLRQHPIIEVDARGFKSLKMKSFLIYVIGKASWFSKKSM